MGSCGFVFSVLDQTQKKSANAQALAIGQIADTVSNIGIVKLFATVHQEDNAALNAFEYLRGTSIEYVKSLTRFRACLLIYSGVIFIAVNASAIALWANGNTSPGAVVAAGSVAMRQMMMAGWVSFSLITIYTNLGEVEGAMHTLAPQHSFINQKVQMT